MLVKIRHNGIVVSDAQTQVMQPFVLVSAYRQPTNVCVIIQCRKSAHRTFNRVSLVFLLLQNNLQNCAILHQMPHQIKDYTDLLLLAHPLLEEIREQENNTTYCNNSCENRKNRE